MFCRQLHGRAHRQPGLICTVHHNTFTAPLKAAMLQLMYSGAHASGACHLPELAGGFSAYCLANASSAARTAAAERPARSDAAASSCLHSQQPAPYHSGTDWAAPFCSCRSYSVCFHTCHLRGRRPRHGLLRAFCRERAAAAGLPPDAPPAAAAHHKDATSRFCVHLLVQSPAPQIRQDTLWQRMTGR